MNPSALREVVQSLKKGAYYVQAEYMRQIPVLSNNARSHVKIELQDRGFKVTTTATRKGFPYPLAVHEGSGKWAGFPIDFPSTGRVRAGETPNRGGILPNRFAMRTFEKTFPVVLKDFQTNLNRIISTYES